MVGPKIVSVLPFVDYKNHGNMRIVIVGTKKGNGIDYGFNGFPPVHDNIL